MRPAGLSLLTTLLLLTFACGDKEPGAGSGDTGAADDGTDGTTGTDGTETLTDLDHDGYFSDVDCDDTDYRRNPGAEEECDGIDNDCDDEVDEGFDQDGDGYVSSAICEDGDDCNDADPNINPGRSDVPYNGEDEDCDGSDLLDADLDGFDSVDYGGNDCDDGDDSIYPGAPEVAKDGIDQNCDEVDLLDGDGDGYDADGSFGGDDCDDEDPDINPGEWDWMNDGLDADCDGRDGDGESIEDVGMVWSGGSGSAYYFGRSTVSCDIDGDGMDDLVVSAPFSADGNTGAGSVGVWFGADAGEWADGFTLSDADTVIEGTEYYGFFGMNAVCFDANGDGYDDLFVADGHHRLDGNGDGWALRQFNGAAVWTPELAPEEADFAYSHDIMPLSSSNTVYSMIVLPWDTDGDGTMDQLAVAAYDGDGVSAPTVGEIWLVPVSDLGAASGPLADLSEVSIALDDEDSLLSGTTAPDLNGDGATELVIGQINSGTGRFLGSLSFISGVPTANTSVADERWASLEGRSGLSDYFGWSAVFGDFDADGNTDAVVGAVGVARGGSANAGALYVYSDVGTALTGTGLEGASTADGTYVGTWSSGQLGNVLGIAGDLNGDGSDDIYVREPLGGLLSDGRIYVLSGALVISEAGLESSVDDALLAELETEASNQSSGSAFAAGDFDGDGAGDLVVGAQQYTSAGEFVGRAYLYLSTLW